MKKLLITILASATLSAFAQTAKVYRAGTLLSTHSSLVAASAAANTIGDSILLSAHTFYEHDIPMSGGQIWQGTMTATDTSTIDAESKGRVGDKIAGSKGRACVIRNIILTHGTTAFSSTKDGGAFYSVNDSLVLRGYSIIRNCHAEGSGGAVFNYIFLYDKVKITKNSSDSIGGGIGNGIFMFDSSELSYNTAKYGGAVGYESGGSISCHSPGVRIHHNTATIAGGAIYGNTQMTAGQITDNQAPMGAAIYTIPCYPVVMQNLRIYNPRLDGTRQNEIYLRSGNLNIEGSWFGQSDTTGLIFMSKDYLFCTTLSGRPAKANWSVNWGKALSKKDTLFPIGAGFTYSDGSLLPANACPWLLGNFISSTGTFLTPQPIMQSNDTLSSLFRTYVYASKGDTSSKPISYVCSIDADTFRVTPMVWGRDTSNLSIFSPKTASQVLVFPNPTTDYLHIQGAAIGSTISLYDLQGKLVKSEEAKGHNVEMDVQALPKGNYLLKITTKGGEEGSAQIVKE